MTKTRQTFPGSSGSSFMRRLICQRVYTVEGVAACCAVRVSGGRYNIALFPLRYIIDRKTWDKVQTMLKSNMNHDSSRRTPKVNPFNGMIYCGSCGGAFSMSHTVKQGNKRYSYYICLEDTKRNFSTCPIK